MRWLSFLRCVFLHDMMLAEVKVAGRTMAWCDRCRRFRHWSW